MAVERIILAESLGSVTDAAGLQRKFMIRRQFNVKIIHERVRCNNGKFEVNAWKPKNQTAPFYDALITGFTNLKG